MSELIDRQDTLDSIIKRLCIKNEEYLLASENVLYQQIKTMPTVQAVPISELKKLRKEMDFVIAKSREEENVLWTCLCMLDIVIESYEDQEESAD